MKLAAIILISLASAQANAQTADHQPSFEAASIKPAGPLATALGKRGPGGARVGFSGGPGTDDPGLLTCNKCVLTVLLMEAYALQPYQLSPSWKDSFSAFDLSAKVPKDATREQVRLMLKNLLAERFKLAVHHEQKEMQVYGLVVAKGGPKLKESVEKPLARDPSDNQQASVADGKPTFDKDGFVVRPPGPNPPKGRMEVGMGGRARIRAEGETMQDLAERLSSAIGKPVIDATGLNGKYDYSLIFALPTGMGGRGNAAPPSDPNTPLSAASDNDTGIPIENEIQSQLGLKLESKKGPVDILVIDHAEKVPTEN